MKPYVYLTALSLCAIPLSLRSQQPSVEDLFGLFQEQLQAWPQEKLYVHTDKSCYIAGEDVWFRAHLVDATYHIADTTSRYVYAELVDPMDSLVCRVKIRPEAGVFQGHISLEPDMPGGDYLLRSYTRFMEARGEEYFFKKTISVGGPFSSRFKIEPSFTFDPQRGRYEAVFRFRDIATDEWVTPAAVRFSDRGRDDLEEIRAKGDGHFSATVSRNARVVYIEYDCGDKRNMEFVTVPPPTGDFDVAFLPEGGNMVQGHPSRVGFKAIDSGGLGVDVFVALMSSAGDTVLTTITQHKGMGRFSLTPQPGLTYHAMCSVSGSTPKRFELPEAVAGGVALRIDRRDSLFNIQLVGDKPFKEPVCLIIHCRGYLLYSTWWENPEKALAIDGSFLPDGVIQVVVADKNLHPLSERLVFNVNPQRNITVGFGTDQPQYGHREHIKSRIDFREPESNEPIGGSFSVSVTDDRYVDTNTSDNIFSNLLLTSELKGYIETPSYYFRDIDNLKLTHLDILMMTQGWSRYNVAGLLRGEIQPPRGYLELGPVLSGTVKGGAFMNRGNPDYPVSIMSQGESPAADQTVTDKDGNFFFNLPELPEGTRYIVQGKTLKDRAHVELLVDPENLPQPSFSVPRTRARNTPALDDYMRRAEEKYIIENGDRQIILDEITVRGESVSNVRHPSYPAQSMSMQTMAEDKLKLYRSVDMALSIMGINVTSDGYYIRGNRAFLQIDGMTVEPDMVKGLTMDDIAEIGVVTDSSVGYLGEGAGNGAVLISTKLGFDQTMRSRQVFNMKAAVPLGYQPLKEFYAPVYETDEQRRSNTPDPRTTIYWNPNVKAGPDGQAEFDFYSGDGIGSYTVVIEGVTADGHPVYSEQKIQGK